MFDILRSGAKSIFIKVIFGLIIIAFIFLGVGNFSTSSSTILAEVNGEPITIHEFWRIYQPEYEKLLSNNPDLRGDKNFDKELRVRILSSMIQERLQMQAAIQAGIFITPHELLQAVSRLTVFQNERGEFDAQRYESILRADGRSPAQFEEQFKKAMLMEKMSILVASTAELTDQEARAFFDFSFEERKVEYVLFANKDFMNKAEVSAEAIEAYFNANQEAFREPARMNIDYVLVTPKSLLGAVSVSDAEAKAYFEEHPEKFVQQQAYHVRHIFLVNPDPATADGLEAAQAQMDKTLADIQEELKKGTSFADLATKYSQEATSAAKGGDMGWINQGELPIAIFETTALAMAPGEVSAPFKTDFGTHIIQLIEKREAGQLPFEKVQDNIIVELSMQKATAHEEAVRLQVADELGKGTPLPEIAASLGLDVKHTGLIPATEIAELLGLQEAAMRTLDNIPVGETAPAPIQGKEGFILLSVVDNQPEHIQALDDSIKAQIKTILQSQAATKLAVEAANAALPAFASGTPEEFAGKTVTSDAFSRINPVIQPFGPVVEMASVLGLAQKGHWAPQVFYVPQGAVIARVSEVIPPSEKFWEKEKQNILQVMLQDKQMTAMNAYLQSLVTKAKITENMDLLFGLGSNS